MSKKASYSAYMKPAHLKAVRALGYTLTLGDPAAWWDLSSILAGRLTLSERAALAFMVLKALDDEAAQMVAEAALDGAVGAPLPPLANYMQDAGFWADMAAPDEVEAYCLATFNRMQPGRQMAFLDHVQGRAAA